MENRGLTASSLETSETFLVCTLQILWRALDMQELLDFCLSRFVWKLIVWAWRAFDRQQRARSIAGVPKEDVYLDSAFQKCFTKGVLKLTF